MYIFTAATTEMLAKNDTNKTGRLAIGSNIMSTVSFPGIASGIDTDLIIQAAMSDYAAVNLAPKQAEVNSLLATNTAFGELSSKLSDLQNTLSVFSSIAGGGVSKIATSSSENIATATVSNSAINSSYGITVNTLAKNATMSLGESGGSAFTSSSGVISGTDSMTFTIGDVSAETVTINAGGMTLDEFVADFNAKTDKAEASVINAGTSSSPDYRILITTNNTGLDSGSITITEPLTGALSNINSSQATNASFELDGVGTITRSTNSISDVISGVTFNLKATGATTIAISNDTEKTSQRVQSFVDAYNKVVNYISENNLIVKDETSPDGTHIFGTLAKTQVDNNFLSEIRTVIASISNASGESIRVFSELGITTQRDGTLKFNSDIFSTALASDPTSVNTMLTSFADATSLIGGTIDQYIRYNGLIDSTVNNNKERIIDVQSNINDIRKHMSRQEEFMKAQYARFESIMGTLFETQRILSSMLEAA